MLFIDIIMETVDVISMQKEVKAVDRAITNSTTYVVDVCAPDGVKNSVAYTSVEDEDDTSPMYRFRSKFTK